ncbi:MAG: hypothetical protein PVH41_12090 [Anaerolineae bacterium]|jgi:hypothetical protein
MTKRAGIIQALRDAALIRRSGLLHEGYYRSQFYKELKADRYLLRLSPVLHYVLFGAHVGKSPNPHFDTEYYLDGNPEVARSGMSPLAHYLRIGGERRRNSSPSFDTGYYLDHNPEVEGSGLDPLSHYFRFGRAAGRSPNPLVATVRSVDLPREADIAEGRAWLQQALGASSAGAPCPLRCPDRIIRFEWDRGGWNNVRMAAEVMVCLAARFGRALVLPDPDRWYLIPGDDTHLFDYFEGTAFRAAVPALPSDTRMEDEWEVPARLAAVNTVRLRTDEFRRQQHRASWYFPKTSRMFGVLASVLGSDPELYRLIHQAFRVRSDLLDLAMELLQGYGLQPGEFLAAHVRRGEFERPTLRNLPVAAVIEALRRHGADAAGSVLIVSDEYDEELLEACRKQGWEPVCWSEQHAGDPKLSGVLDMLCCCLGWRFVGTPLSTFTTGIIQWRGYVSRVAGSRVEAIPRFTAEVEQIPWWGVVDPLAWLSI